MTRPASFSAALSAISSAFVDARTSHRALSEFPGQLPDTLAEAYAIQALSIERWDQQIAGWKVGGIKPPLRQVLGADRLTGPIFANRVCHAQPGVVSPMKAFANGFIAVEAEFVIRLGKVDALPDRCTRLEDLMSVIDAVHVGVEIASSPLRIINQLGPLAVISDFGNNAGLLIGARLEQWSPDILDGTAMCVELDDQVVGQCCAPAGLDGPLGAVAFLIAHARRMGQTLPPGTWVSSGAVTGIHPAQLGSVARVTLDGYPSIDLTIVDQ